MTDTAAHIELTERYVAHNYHPLPVVITEGNGAWVRDGEGRRYLDCLAAYSAVNFGHRHPDLVAAATDQLDRVSLTSRAFHHDQLGPFCAELSALVERAPGGAAADDDCRPGRADSAGGAESGDAAHSHAAHGDASTASPMVLPMNTGAEAVESALKVARKWAYEVKGVPEGAATIVVASGNFHGRTLGIVSFSDDPDARGGFGPYLGGFRTVPYGDIDALSAAVDETTAAVLLEPIQGEAGVVVPPPDYLPLVRALCQEQEILFIADEIQSGLGRTGRTFACDHAAVVPDLYLLGKALGGGIVPVSAVVGRADVLEVLHPGQHGSTFGGNPLGCAVGRAVVRLLREGRYTERARLLGEVLHQRLAALVGHGVLGVRGVGLWAGVDIDPALATGREICTDLAQRGVLVKDTHGSTIRLAPPLVVTEDDVSWAVDQLAAVLCERARPRATATAG